MLSAVFAFAMEAACEVLELVSRLDDGARPPPPGDWAAVSAVLASEEAAALWPALAGRGVQPSALGSGLCALLVGPSKAAALHAAAAYAQLLGSPGCPVFSLFNAVAFEATLKALRDAAAAAAAAAVAEKGRAGKGKAAKAARAAAARAAARMEVDGEAEEEGEEEAEEELFEKQGAAVEPAAARAGAVAVLAGLRAALAQLPLRDQPEAAKQATEALAAVAAAPPALGLGQESLAALRQLLQPAHGDALPAAAAQLQRLSPVLLASSGRGTAGAAALEHARALAQELPAARPAVAALVRHLCLRCGDKADARARVRPHTRVPCALWRPPGSNGQAGPGAPPRSREPLSPPPGLRGRGAAAGRAAGVGDGLLCLLPGPPQP